MDQITNVLKKLGTYILKKSYKPILIISTFIFFCSVGMFYIVIKDGSHTPGDPANTPSQTSSNLSITQINSDGTISRTISAQELWNQMIENKSRVDEYLDGPEELQELMNAQSITEYLDTRPNPDEEIDWEAINNNVNSLDVQGIIKLKRARNDGTISTLIYTDPETYQMYIDNYNETGSDEDKYKALSYFTLERGYSSANFGAGGSGAPIVAGTVINIPSGLGSVHTYMGWQMITSTTSTQYRLREQAGMNFDSEGFGRINGRYVIACTTTYGSVGDYIDFYQEDGSVIQCIIGDIKNQNDVGCNEWGHLNGACIVEFVVNKDTWYYCNHPNPGTSSCHPEWNQNLTKAINGGSYFDNPEFGSENIEGNGTSSENTGDKMRWPTDSGVITSEFGMRIHPITGEPKMHKGIDIGGFTGELKNIYAIEAGTVTTAGYSSSAGNWIVIDHGNGYVSKYMHNSSLLVSVGDVVYKGQHIAIAGNTGNSTGVHLHFQIEYQGNPVDPLSFEYVDGMGNGMGNGVGGIGSNTTTLSTTGEWYAKVATWVEVNDKLESDDPDVANYNNTTYRMTSTPINYKEFVSKYEMPFDYLWAWLVMSQDKEFIFELTDLVYNSEIDITVHDNLAINTNISVDKYNKKTKIETNDIEVKVTYQDNSSDATTYAPTTHSTTCTHNDPPFEGELENSYTTTHTVITKTNTLDVALTKANVWLMNYMQEFKQEALPEETTVSSRTIPDEQYPDSADEVTNAPVDPLRFAEQYRKSVQDSYEGQGYTNVSAVKESWENKHYHKIVNRTINITNTLNKTNYISSPPIIEEKVDKNDENPNFVNILAKYANVRGNINSAASWLFRILETGPNTCDMVDLTKYLIYKTTGAEYKENLDEYSIENDYKIFGNDDFDGSDWTTVGTSGGGNSDWSYTGVSCPRYIQSDSRWGNLTYAGDKVSSSGCGACALAMAVSGLTGQNVTPVEIVTYLNSIGKNTVTDGAGCAQAIASKYGLTYEFINRDNQSAINQALDAGKCLIFSIKANTIYTGTGHFIMCHGRSGNKYYVLESGRFYESNKGYAFDEVFTRGSQGIFALGK